MTSDKLPSTGSHIVDAEMYRPRFTSDGDSHPVKQPKGLDAYAMPDTYAKAQAIVRDGWTTMEQVEASRDPYHIASPIYTREELVEIVAKAWYEAQHGFIKSKWDDLKNGQNYLSCAEPCVSELIAIGALRVK